VRPLLWCALLLAGCSPRLPDFRARTGIIELPAGTLVLHRPLVVAPGASHLEIRGHPAGSTLQAAPDFQGRAVIVSQGTTDLRLTGFRVEGNRAAIHQPIGLPPSETPFARYYAGNGILVEHATRLTVRNVTFHEVANYPLLVSASSGVIIDGVRIEDCGSLDAAGHNNASGGILLEEGTAHFQVRHCTLRRVRGNGIWTHSNYHSPRNADGTIADNLIEQVARDAIQVGHATNVRVENNRGGMIGYPFAWVDMAAYAVPAALDTAGNVDRSVYAGNRFQDIDGKCIDLDGFHDGEVRGNSCISRQPAGQYPYAQYGMVFNNSNPDMQPVNVTVAGNLIEGAGYGGIFVIGAHHVITGNRLLGLNRDHCTGDMAQPRCNFAPDQPGLLHSGIYLGRRGQRPADTRDNRIEDNQISGFDIRGWCVAAAPGVSLARNRIGHNRCTDTRQ
jgi:Right handed beta helix region